MGILSLISILAFWGVSSVKAEDPYKFYTWTVTYGIAAPLGVPQQVLFLKFFFLISHF